MSHKHKSQACKVSMTTLHMSGNHKESSHPKKVQNDAYLILTTEREGGWGGQGVRSPSTVGTGQAHESRG